MVILRNLRDMNVQTAVDMNTSLNVCTDTILKVYKEFILFAMERK